MFSLVLIFFGTVLLGGFMVMEMLLCESPGTRAAFGTTEAFATESKAMAANQGLCNGFLLAGLIWALLIGLLGAGQGIALFFLTCIVVAGVFGAVTVSARRLLVQALPAALAIVAVLLGR